MAEENNQQNQNTNSDNSAQNQQSNTASSVNASDTYFPPLQNTNDDNRVMKGADGERLIKE